MSHPTADVDCEVRQLRHRVRILEAMFHQSRELIFTLDFESRVTGSTKPQNGPSIVPKTNSLA